MYCHIRYCHNPSWCGKAGYACYTSSLQNWTLVLVNNFIYFSSEVSHSLYTIFHRSHHPVNQATLQELHLRRQPRPYLVLELMFHQILWREHWTGDSTPAALLVQEACVGEGAASLAPVEWQQLQWCAPCTILPSLRSHNWKLISSQASL